jgi:hypothetical protein
MDNYKYRTTANTNKGNAIKDIVFGGGNQCIFVKKNQKEIKEIGKHKTI